MTSCLQEQIKKKKHIFKKNPPKTTISKLNLHTNNNKDWSGRKEPNRATVFSLEKSDFVEIINKLEWGFNDEEDGWILFAYEYHTHNNYNSLYYHNQVAIYLHGKGAKHGDLVLSPSRWWDNVDDISNVYRIYTVKQSVPTIELIGSDIARYLNEDGWVEDEPIIGFSSSDIKYSLGPNYPVGYWGGVSDTQNECGGGGDGTGCRQISLY